MRTLILGGTGFIGRHLVAALGAQGHEVTLFHRGLSAGGRVAGVREIIGDRSADLPALDAEAFDPVVDTSGYEPAPVRAALRRLASVLSDRSPTPFAIPGSGCRMAGMLTRPLAPIAASMCRPGSTIDASERSFGMRSAFARTRLATPRP